MAGVPDISICIATRGRTHMLTACLDSLATQHDPPSFEVLVAGDLDHEVEVVVGGRFPLAAVAQMSDEHQRPLAPSDKRNELVARAQGELLLFLDDDVVCHPELLRRLTDLATLHPDEAVFGGPNVTPPGRSLVQVVQGAVLGSIVAAGPVRKRWGRHPEGNADDRYFTLCNMAVRRAAMVPFPLGLRTGEEIAVLNELHRRGHRMRYHPDLLVFHERRPTVAAFARQIFNYGRGRGRIVRADPRSLRPHHVAPILLVAYLAALPVLGAVYPIAVLPLVVYTAAVLTQAAKIGLTIRRHRPGAARATALAARLIVIVHVWYAVGIVAGLIGPRPPARRSTASWSDGRT